MVDQLCVDLNLLFTCPAFAVALCVVAGTKTQFYTPGGAAVVAV